MSKTVGLKQLVRDVEDDYEDIRHLRPRTRRDCENGLRPCPYIGCRYNLYLDVTDAGSLKFNFPGLEPEEVPPEKSCCLDVVEDTNPLPDGRPPNGEAVLSLEQVGRLLGLTRERTRQIVQEVKQKIVSAIGEE